MSECPICLDEIVKKAVLSCNHEMCSLCIIRWLNEDNTCPICRAEIDIQTPEFRAILNRLSMRELGDIIKTLNRENSREVSRNEVFVTQRALVPRRRRCNYICINISHENREEIDEIFKMIIVLMISCIMFLCIFLFLR